MKKLALLALSTLALSVSSTTFAATATTEPALPSDMAAYGKPWQTFQCSKFAITAKVYGQNNGSEEKRLAILTKNSEKIAQVEQTRSRDGAETYVYYARN